MAYFEYKYNLIIMIEDHGVYYLTLVVARAIILLLFLFTDTTAVGVVYSRTLVLCNVLYIFCSYYQSAFCFLK